MCFSCAKANGDNASENSTERRASDSLSGEAGQQRHYQARHLGAAGAQDEAPERRGAGGCGKGGAVYPSGIFGREPTSSMRFLLILRRRELLTFPRGWN